MNIFLASGNAHKLEEIRHMVAEAGVAVSVDSATAIGGMPEVEESAGTFTGNARLKAEALLPQAPADAWVLADDSGLEVDALAGEPGVYSSRYAGPDASDRDNLEKLLTALKGIPHGRRTARFRCVLVLKNRDGAEHVFEGTCEGYITESAVGEGGFGYDPAFAPDGYTETFGQLGESVKSQRSHRALALKLLLQWAETNAPR